MHCLTARYSHTFHNIARTLMRIQTFFPFGFRRAHQKTDARPVLWPGQWRRPVIGAARIRPRDRLATAARRIWPVHHVVLIHYYHELITIKIKNKIIKKKTKHPRLPSDGSVCGAHANTGQPTVVYIDFADPTRLAIVRNRAYIVAAKRATLRGDFIVPWRTDAAVARLMLRVHRGAHYTECSIKNDPFVIYLQRYWDNRILFCFFIIIIFIHKAKDYSF